MNFDSKLLLRVAIIVGVIAGIYFLAAHFLKGVVDPDHLLDLIRDAGPYAPLVFIGLFIFSPGIPASGLAIASGAIFGFTWGVIYSVIGAILATIPPFWFARLLGRKPLDKLLSKVGGSVETHVEKFQVSVEKHGWRYVAMCRLIPLFPFSLLNLVFGLTRISFWTYFLTSAVFVIPGMCAFVYIGYAGNQAASGNSAVYWKAILALLGLALLACLPQLIKFYRNWRKDKKD